MNKKNNDLEINGQTYNQYFESLLADYPDEQYSLYDLYNLLNNEVGPYLLTHCGNKELCDNWLTSIRDGLLKKWGYTLEEYVWYRDELERAINRQ